MVKEQEKLSNIWERFKPKLESMYGQDSVSVASMQNIQAALYDWANQIDTSPWKNLHTVFTDNGFELNSFQNGLEFKNAVLKFVDQEIQQNKKKRYNLFVENMWAEEIEPQWLPYLIDTHRLTTDDTDEINSKITEWSSLSNHLIWFIIGGVVICVFVIGSVIIRRRKPV